MTKRKDLKPHLSELKVWLDNGQDFPRPVEEMLYEVFFQDMPYGTLTGDDSTFDEWISDHPHLIEELISELEMEAA